MTVCAYQAQPQDFTRGLSRDAKLSMINARSAGLAGNLGLPQHTAVSMARCFPWLDLHRVRATSAQRRSSLGPVRARRLLTQAYDDDLQFFVPHLLKCGDFAGRRLARDRPPARSANLVRRAHRPWRICLKVRAPDRTEMWLAPTAF